MLKIFRLVCFLLVFVIANLYSADCVAYGYGQTEEEARSDAYRSLVASLLGENIASTSESSIVYTSDNNNSVRSYSRSSINMVSSSAISGIIYIYDGGGGINGFRCTATLSDSHRNEYVNKAINAKQSIEGIYSTLDIKDEGATKEFYSNLLIAIRDFETYRTIAMALGASNDEIPNYNIPETYQSILNKYESILYGEESVLKEQRINVDNDRLLEIDAQLKQNREEQKKIEEDLKKRIEQEQRMRDAQLSAMINQIKEKTSYNSIVVQSSDLNGVFKQIKERIEDYNNICSEYDKLLNDEISRIDSEIAIEVSAIKDKKYRIGELTRDKKPSEKALSVRNSQIEEYLERKENEKLNVQEILKQNLGGRIQELYDNATETILYFENNDLSLNTVTKTLKTEERSFDGNDSCWYFKAYTEIDGLKIDLGLFKLSYNNIVQEYKKESYDEYLENIDKLDRLFEDDFSSGLYDLEIKAQLVIDAYTGEFKIKALETYLYQNSNNQRHEVSTLEIVETNKDWISLGVKMIAEEYDFLQIDNNFNVNAKNILNAEYVARKKADKEKQREIKKQQKIENKEELRNLALQYYGVKHFLHYGIRGYIAWGGVIGDKTSYFHGTGNDYSLFWYSINLDFEYLFSRRFYISLTPTFTHGFYHNTSRYVNKSAPIQGGVLIGVGYFFWQYPSHAIGIRFSNNECELYIRFTAGNTSSKGRTIIEMGPTYKYMGRGTHVIGIYMGVGYVY